MSDVAEDLDGKAEVVLRWVKQKSMLFTQSRHAHLRQGPG